MQRSKMHFQNLLVKKKKLVTACPRSWMENLYPLKRLKKVLFQGSIKKDREKGKLHQKILSSGVNLPHSNEDI